MWPVDGEGGMKRLVAANGPNWNRLPKSRVSNLDLSPLIVWTLIPGGAGRLTMFSIPLDQVVLALRVMQGHSGFPQ